MTAKTSTQDGLASVITWSPAGVPATGDTIICNHLVDLDYNLENGSSTSGVGHAVSVAAGARFRVLAGVTHTRAGFDRVNNTCGRTLANGEYNAQPGSTIIDKIASSGQSCFLNAGLYYGLGTAQNPISHSGFGQSWATAGGTATGTVASTEYYDNVNKVYCYPLGNVDISNAAGTARGSFGDSSLSFSASVPASSFITEVASVELINALGKYFVDYATGNVYFYKATAGNFSFTPVYKYCTYFGSTIQCIGNVNNNELKLAYYNFSYMGNFATDQGSAVGEDWILNIQNKNKTGTKRDFDLDHVTFSHCRRTLGLKNVVGQLGNEIKIKDLTWDGIDGDAYGTAIGIYRASNSFIIIDRPKGNVRSSQAGGSTAFPFLYVQGSAGAQITQDTILINDAFIDCAQFLDGGQPDQVVFPDSIYTGLAWGIGAANDSRQFTNWAGKVNHPAIWKGMSWRAMRIMNVGPYSWVRSPGFFGAARHHSIDGPATAQDLAIPGVDIDSAVFAYLAGGAAVELGYNRHYWFDNPKVTHCTVINSNQSGATGAMAFGDTYDNGPGCQQQTALVMASNLVKNCVNGFVRPADAAGVNTRVHTSLADYNATHGNSGSAYSGIPRFNLATGIVNIAGVSLNFTSYAALVSGKSLVFTYTSATNQTLAWDGGVAVQLIHYSSLATGGANGGNVGTTPQNGSLTDSLQAWPSGTGALNNAACPSGNWVVMTGGAGAGQIRKITNNTATVLTVVPQWTTIPAATDSYIIIKNEVTLTASDLTNTVVAALDQRLMPTSTQTDAVSIATNGRTDDPLFIDINRTPSTWDAFLGGAGTETGARARILADSTLVRTSLVPYLRYGVTPLNVAYWTGAHDGTTIGAVQFTGLIRPKFVKLGVNLRRAFIRRRRQVSSISLRKAPTPPAPAPAPSGRRDKRRAFLALLGLRQ